MQNIYLHFGFPLPAPPSPSLKGRFNFSGNQTPALPEFWGQSVHARRTCAGSGCLVPQPIYGCSPPDGGLSSLLGGPTSRRRVVSWVLTVSVDHLDSSTRGAVNEAATGSVGRFWSVANLPKTTVEIRVTRRDRPKPAQTPEREPRRFKLRSLTGGDTGCSVFTNDGALLAVDLARALDAVRADPEPWPKGVRRPLP